MNEKALFFCKSELKAYQTMGMHKAFFFKQLLKIFSQESFQA